MNPGEFGDMSKSNYQKADLRIFSPSLYVITSIKTKINYKEKPKHYSLFFLTLSNIAQ
jgi:hypothetical protein